MKLVFITVAASLLGGVIVAASTSADGQITTKLQDRAPMAQHAETVRVVEVSSCTDAPDIACVEHRGGGPGEDPRAAFDASVACILPPPGPGPLILASRLAAMESFIGIREEQLDAWRAYTDALYAMLHPPAAQEKAPAGGPPDALAQSAMLAACAAGQGRAADRLTVAIGELRGRLTPEQFDRLKQAGPLLPPRPPGPPPGAPPFATPASFGPFGSEGPGEADHPTPH